MLRFLVATKGRRMSEIRITDSTLEFHILKVKLLNKNTIEDTFYLGIYKNVYCFLLDFQFDIHTHFF